MEQLDAFKAPAPRPASKGGDVYGDLLGQISGSGAHSNEAKIKALERRFAASTTTGAAAWASGAALAPTPAPPPQPVAASAFHHQGQQQQQQEQQPADAPPAGAAMDLDVDPLRRRGGSSDEDGAPAASPAAAAAAAAAAAPMAPPGASAPRGSSPSSAAGQQGGIKRRKTGKPPQQHRAQPPGVAVQGGSAAAPAAPAPTPARPASAQLGRGPSGSSPPHQQQQRQQQALHGPSPSKGGGGAGARGGGGTAGGGAGTGANPPPNPPPSSSSRDISAYFQQRPASGAAAAAAAAAAGAGGVLSTPLKAGANNSSNPAASPRQQTNNNNNNNNEGAAAAAAAAATRAMIADLRARLSGAERDTDALRGAAARLQGELASERARREAREARAQCELAALVAAGAQHEATALRLKLAADGARLGAPAVQRAGALGFTEVWEDGPAFAELRSRAQALQVRRDELEAARKALRRRLPPAPKMAGVAAAAAAAAAAAFAGSAETPPSDFPGGDGGFGGGGGGGGDGAATPPGALAPPLAAAEYVARDEILKSRLASLRREEEALAREDERLCADRARHARALKRLRDEEASRFGARPLLLGGRYALASLLGKGGFSEVFRAYDTRRMRWVAVKVHQLSQGWPEQRKQAYVRHAVREYSIHRALRHPHIVGLLDIFEVDSAAFATVLELCEGGDLDTVLREHGTLPEREVRAIMAQIFSGLAYLNQPSSGDPTYPPGTGPYDAGAAAAAAPSDAAFAAASAAAAAAALADPDDPPPDHPAGSRPPRVIHYDLKPANVLFDACGGAKLTDFGLSKVVDDGCTQAGVELTSHGAGTYWYLPPECFAAFGGNGGNGGGGGGGVGGRTGLGGGPGRGGQQQQQPGGGGGGGGLLSALGVVPPSSHGAVGGGGTPSSAAAAAAASEPPRISNKVDVWSAGVLMYQALFGRRPFGEGQSQEQVLREGVVLRATAVDFPTRPAVSAEAREFVRRCLAYRQEDRWDVLTAAADAYLALKR